MAPSGATKSKKKAAGKKAPARGTAAKKPVKSKMSKASAARPARGAKTTAALKPKKKTAPAAAKGTAKKARAKKAPTTGFTSMVQKALPLIPGVGRWIGRTVG
jgi:hypothetical protein